MKGLSKERQGREKESGRERERDRVRETDSGREAKGGKSETERAVGVIGPQAKAG